MEPRFLVSNPPQQQVSVFVVRVEFCGTPDLCSSYLSILGRVLVLSALIGNALSALLVIGSVVFCEGALRVPPNRGEPAVPSGIQRDTAWRVATIRTLDSIALEGWFIRPSGNHGSRCVVVLHGITDSRLGSAGFAPMFLAEGYSVLLPDSRAQRRQVCHLRPAGEV